jgi:hypothetical protein
MGMEPVADGEDGPLSFGGDPSRVLVAGRRPIVETLSLSARKGTTSTPSGPNRCSEHSCRLKCPSATVTDKALGSGLHSGLS